MCAFLREREREWLELKLSNRFLHGKTSLLNVEETRIKMAE